MLFVLNLGDGLRIKRGLLFWIEFSDSPLSAPRRLMMEVLVLSLLSVATHSLAFIRRVNNVAYTPRRSRCMSVGEPSPTCVRVWVSFFRVLLIFTNIIQPTSVPIAYKTAPVCAPYKIISKFIKTNAYTHAHLLAAKEINLICARRNASRCIFMHKYLPKEHPHIKTKQKSTTKCRLAAKQH